MNESEPPPLPITRKTAGISGFWRRLVAFLLDGIILGLPAFILGLFLFDQFARLGGWGRIVGFVVAFLYFALMNSALAGGRTVGKRLMHIRVVDSNDSLITVGRSSARYLILAIPYFLNGAPISPRVLLGWIGILFSFLVFGIGFSIIYLFVFNRRTRQSLHDLVVGTFVIRSERSPAVAKPKVWAGHYVVVALIFIASLFAPLLLSGLITESPFKELLPLQSSLMDLPDVRYASVFAGKSFVSDSKGTRWTSDVSVAIQVNKRIQDYDAFANGMARAVFDNYPEATQKDRLILTLIYGYDIGIAHSSISRGYNFSPAEWRQRIQSQSGGSL
jgi:uncharacterized RDD family membrane protein YckC